MVRRETIVVIVDLERKYIMNWGKNNGQVMVYIYNIVSHDLVDTLPKYQQSHVILTLSKV